MWWNVGVGWLLYFNVYRIHVDMSVLGNAALQAFSRGYTTRLPIVVLPYGLMCLLAVLGLWSESGRISLPATPRSGTGIRENLYITPSGLQ